MPPAEDDRPSGTNLATWRSAPFSQWAFHHVREIVPTAEIGAAEEPWALPVATQSLDGFGLRAPDGALLDLDDFLRATATDALVVMLGGRIVHESYAHGMAERTPHIIMSATKSVVGLIAGILQAQGLLDVEAPVSDLVPEIAGTAWRGATIRHLLDMRTGVVLDAAQLRAYDLATGWSPAGPGEIRGDLHSFFTTLTAPWQPHGGPFRYVSANTDLLGWAIERATGKSFAALANALLWRPMGAAEPAYITLDPEGAPRCTGGLCMAARDLARIGQLIVEGGRRGDREILPPGWIDDIARNGDREAWQKGEFAPGFAGMTMSYRGSWYVIHDAPEMIFAMGIHGQNLFVDRANGLVVAKISSQTHPIDHQAIMLTHRAVAEIGRGLWG
jgi:CubicO group peptidase (beta-lactamase class C family)